MKSPTKGARTAYNEILHRKSSWFDLHEMMLQLGYSSTEVDRYALLENHNGIATWCSNNFGHKHWVSVTNIFFSRIYFTHEEDLTFFLLRWGSKNGT